MADLFGIPHRRLPIAVAMIVVLVAAISWLQGRFEQSDVKKAIAMALAFRPAATAPTIFDGLVALGQGDPRCDGRVLSNLLGDVEVICATAGKPAVEYEFRVLLDGKRPPRPANAAGEQLVSRLAAPK
jgi:hypothetical protein